MHEIVTFLGVVIVALFDQVVIILLASMNNDGPCGIQCIDKLLVGFSSLIQLIQDP